MKAILFVLALTFASHAWGQEDTYAMLEKMEEKVFSKTLLDTIDLQLQSSDSIDLLLKVLNDMEQRLLDEQHEDDAYIHDLQVECYESTTALQSEINIAQARVDQIQEELDEKVPLRNRKNEELSERNGEKVNAQDYIIQLYKDKQVRDSEWEVTQEDHSKASYVITTAKDALQGSLVAFVQKSGNIFTQLSQHFSQSAKKVEFKKMRSFNGLFHILAQITASTPIQADQSQVQKIIDLCDELLKKISDSLDFERRSYNNYVSEYDRTVGDLVNKIAQLDAQINDLTSEINVLNKRINMILTEKHEQQSRIKQKQTELKEKDQTCDDAAEQYSHRREERDEQKQTVSQTIGVINQKLRIFKKYLADRKSRK